MKRHRKNMKNYLTKEKEQWEQTRQEEEQKYREKVLGIIDSFEEEKKEVNEEIQQLMTQNSRFQDFVSNKIKSIHSKLKGEDDSVTGKLKYEDF